MNDKSKRRREESNWTVAVERNRWEASSQPEEVAYRLRDALTGLSLRSQLLRRATLGGEIPADVLEEYLDHAQETVQTLMRLAQELERAPSDEVQAPPDRERQREWMLGIGDQLHPTTDDDNISDDTDRRSRQE